MFKKLLILFFILIKSFIFAQNVEPKKWKFAFQLDNRFSSISNHNITIFGAKVGLQYKNKTRFGVATSFILTPVTFEYFNKKMKTQETNTLNFWYFSGFNDLILYKKNNWECFITEQVGYGKPSFIKEVNDEIVSDVNIGLFVNEFSGQVNYKINSWSGVGAGFGYRNLLNGNKHLANAINAPIYIVKLIVYPDSLF